MALALTRASKVPIHSTAGAIPVRNEKGEITMEKVKVQRYVSGKRPVFAPHELSDDEEEIEFGGLGKKKKAGLPQLKTDAEKDDRRLRRLQERKMELEEEGDEENDDEDRVTRHRRLLAPEVLATGSDGDDEEDEEEEEEEEQDMEEEESSEEEEEEELDEEEIERRRSLLRERAKQQREEELMDKEEEKSDDHSEEESSEYEEYTDSEVEDIGPRLKPVFVRKKDRVTIQEKEKEIAKQKELEKEATRMAEERRRQTLRIVEDEARKEVEQQRAGPDPAENADTDDDNDEEEYEAWKLRELKRIKRDREERETVEKDQLEIERIHNLTEEERRQELKMNPKVVTNKAVKGKYKFLQKYYHRGAFFLDDDKEVFKRDFSMPTLEDHFNKTILPKVMQVKNFGRSGRTKYTHLVDQDTTAFDSPWADAASSHKFHATKGGGMKQVFEKPSVKKRK